MNKKITDYEKIFEVIKSSKHCIVFTGAGISTLSGIPDFRSPNNEIWEKYDQSKIFNIDYFYKHPEDFYDFAKILFDVVSKSEPNIVHKLVYELVQKNIVKSVITQNIDMLHQKSGIKQVLELHGSPISSKCIKCNDKYVFNDLLCKIYSDIVPKCDKCNSLIKPDVVFYGEQLNHSVLTESINNANKADLCLVFGTSLVVYPAAMIPEIVARNNNNLIIVNNSETHLDGYALFKEQDLHTFCENILDLFQKS